MTALLLAALLAQAADAPAAPPPPPSASTVELRFESMSREQLFQRRLELERERPGLIAPIALMGGGALLALASTPLFVFGAGVGGYRSSGERTAMLASGGAVALVGVGLVVVGVVVLSNVLKLRSLTGLQIDMLDRQLELLEKKLGVSVTPSGGLALRF